MAAFPKAETSYFVGLRCANPTLHVELNNLGKQKMKKSGLMHDLLTGKVQVTVDNNTAEAAHD
ncbi:MAG: hypothetical protein BECKG1743D_GA0114223_107374 [Candidatus Kentron sp. G]|nr:MAG: hypothetical protein BECKG1743F_GA0114225_108653 [Candidatus Kentron sp. G]VFN05326.1 MAG: hypothetical protein BECKG1743E_GA0114224_108502 [Candidatus Kentron sp. G]VFN05573.1 MAG: hypothetical protein BECKG1743D_GA0114223_107374 [Candidatus Kentron sp. G]